MSTPTKSFRPSKKNPNLISDLQELANKNNRSLNQYMEILLSDHVNSQKLLRIKK